MLTKEENERFTRVGPGTPGGEMLRRYWWPVAFATEVKGKRPKKIRLLGEDFVMFRDGAARCGMLDLKCAHRRVSLEHGRVEAQGIAAKDPAKGYGVQMLDGQWYWYETWLNRVREHCLEKEAAYRAQPTPS